MTTPPEEESAADKAACESFELFANFNGDKRDNFISRKSPIYSLRIKDFTLKIKQDAELLGGAGVTGAAVWDSAVVLAKLLEKHPQLVSGMRCIEIGAGTGLSGLAAARLGCRSIVLTDQPHMLPLLRENTEDNVAHGIAKVLELTWAPELPIWARYTRKVEEKSNNEDEEEVVEGWGSNSQNDQSLTAAAAAKVDDRTFFQDLKRRHNTHDKRHHHQPQQQHSKHSHHDGGHEDDKDHGNEEAIATTTTSHNDNTGFDVVIAADCVFNEHINADLMSVLTALVPPDSDGVILLSTELRYSSVMENFLERAVTHFDMFRIPHEQWHPQFVCDSIVMYAMIRPIDQHRQGNFHLDICWDSKRIQRV